MRLYHKPCFLVVLFLLNFDFIQGSLCTTLYLTKMHNHDICPDVKLKCQHLGY